MQWKCLSFSVTKSDANIFCRYLFVYLIRFTQASAMISHGFKRLNYPHIAESCGNCSRRENFQIAKPTETALRSQNVEFNANAVRGGGVVSRDNMWIIYIVNESKQPTHEKLDQVELCTNIISLMATYNYMVSKNTKIELHWCGAEIRLYISWNAEQGYRYRYCANASNFNICNKALPIAFC